METQQRTSKNTCQWGLDWFIKWGWQYFGDTTEEFKKIHVNGGLIGSLNGGGNIFHHPSTLMGGVTMKEGCLFKYAKLNVVSWSNFIEYSPRLGRGGACLPNCDRRKHLSNKMLYEIKYHF